MEKRKVVFVAYVGCIMMLSGCGRVTDWMYNEFTQSDKIDYGFDPSAYLKSIVQYDQFTTVVMFDALWLSDSVRTAYANLHSLKQGKSLELSNAFLRRQLEENKHFISFYILTPYDVPLSDKNSPWSVTLDIDGNFFTPIEIKIAELNPEYQSFFGKHLNQFKGIYHVKWQAKDANDQPLITDETRMIRLIFRSVNREAVLEWPMYNGMLLENE